MSTINVVEKVLEFVNGRDESLWSGEGFHMWKDKEDFFHFKLDQTRQRICEEAMWDIVYDRTSISELKVKLRQSVDIIMYLESHGKIREKAKKDMDTKFGLFLMRSPEVKRWS